MGLTKKERLEVWNKSGGYCWYCGCGLPEKGWHADHFEPVLRYFSGADQKVKVSRKDRDNIDNIVPSCAACNNFKHRLTVEQFREALESQIEKGRRYSSHFRQAERFGLIEVKSKKVIFWFEDMCKKFRGHLSVKEKAKLYGYDEMPEELQECPEV